MQIIKWIAIVFGYTLQTNVKVIRDEYITFCDKREKMSKIVFEIGLTFEIG